MDLSKETSRKLKKFVKIFNDAKERDANEADTVMYLVHFFESILGYDSLSGEISKEVKVQERYCDFGVKINGDLKFLVEAKKVASKSLHGKDIEQAENYASRLAIKWVLLTNGIEWKLYNLIFSETEGIDHYEVFSVNLIEEFDKSPEKVWDCIGLLHKESIKKGILDKYLTQKKALSPASLVRILFSQNVLCTIRREINKNSKSKVKLEIEDVFEAIKDVISKDALLEVGDISLKKRSRRKRRKNKTDNSGNIIKTEEVTEEIKEEADDFKS